VLAIPMALLFLTPRFNIRGLLMSLAIGLGPIKHGNFEELALIPMDYSEFTDEFLSKLIDSTVFYRLPSAAEYRLDCFVQFTQA